MPQRPVYSSPVNGPELKDQQNRWGVQPIGGRWLGEDSVRKPLCAQVACKWDNHHHRKRATRRIVMNNKSWSVSDLLMPSTSGLRKLNKYDVPACHDLAALLFEQNQRFIAE
jgi:hypothetical protein